MGEVHDTTEPGTGDPALPAERSRLLRLLDRVPTTWFVGMATALFLAVTAAFGGLSTAEGAPVPHLERGQEHRNQQFALTVDSAYLRTPGGVAPDRRELVVYVDAVNLWTSPQLTAVEGLSRSVSLTRLPNATTAGTSRVDDGTPSPVLQPGVQARIALTWTVPSADFAANHPLELTLVDLTPRQGSFLVSGEYWTDPVPGATVTVPVADLGSGTLP